MKNQDRHMILSNLELPHFRLQDMKIKPPYPAQRDDFESPLRPDKFKQTFSIFLHRSYGTFSSIPNRINFLQMGRFGSSAEQQSRIIFMKPNYWYGDSNNDCYQIDVLIILLRTVFTSLALVKSTLALFFPCFAK